MLRRVLMTVLGLGAKGPAVREEVNGNRIASTKPDGS